MAKIWRIFPGEWCKYCDSPVLIYTGQDLENGYGYDGDKVVCTKCEAKGEFAAYQNGNINGVEWGNKDHRFWKDYFKSQELKIASVLIMLQMIVICVVYYFLL